MRIEGCDISTGDDCICHQVGPRRPRPTHCCSTTEDVLITNCTFADSIFACIGIGSETSGGIRNVRIEHCKFTHAQTFAIYIKSRAGRGAFIEDIIADDLDVGAMNGGFLRVNMLIQRHPGSGSRARRGRHSHAPQFPLLKHSSYRLSRCWWMPLASIPISHLTASAIANLTGTAVKGISLANIVNADLRDIHVTGVNGPLIGIHTVTGKGLEGAATIDGPKVPDPIPAPAKPYVLR